MRKEQPCPVCGKAILVAARRCRFCKSAISGSEEPTGEQGAPLGAVSVNSTPVSRIQSGYGLSLTKRGETRQSQRSDWSQRTSSTDAPIGAATASSATAGKAPSTSRSRRVMISLVAVVTLAVLAAAGWRRYRHPDRDLTANAITDTVTSIAGKDDAASPLSPTKNALVDVEAAIGRELGFRLISLNESFVTVKSAQDIGTLWKEAGAIAEQMRALIGTDREKWLSETHDQWPWLEDMLPGVQRSCGAECTVMDLAIDPAAWKARASQTPEPDDDQFFGIAVLARGQAGYWAWQIRNSDYEGCSALGNGLLLSLLRATEAPNNIPEFQIEIARIRSAAISHLSGEDSFQICGEETSEEHKKALAERRTIELEIALTAEERAILAKQIPFDPF